MNCPRCGGTMQQKMVRFVTKGKDGALNHTNGTQMAWYCRDCMVSSPVAQSKS